MQASQLGRDFDLSTYNALMSVEEADREVRRDTRLGAFLDAAANVLLAHRMESRFGVALLHRHNVCAAGEHMIEYADVFRDSDVLITRPTARAPRQDGAVPTVWANGEDGFLPLEFTTDAKACDLFGAGDVPAPFLSDFAALTQASPIGRLIGLAVVDRAFYGGAKPNDIALEYSNLLERSNVVFLSDRAASEGKSIETAWRFQTVIEASARCVDTRECIRICHKGDGPGGHTGEQVHTPGPGEHMPT